MRWDYSPPADAALNPHAGFGSLKVDLEMLMHGPGLQLAAEALSCGDLSETWKGQKEITVVSDQYFFPLLLRNPHFAVKLRKMMNLPDVTNTTGEASEVNIRLSCNY